MTCEIRFLFVGRGMTHRDRFRRSRAEAALSSLISARGLAANQAGSITV